MAKRSRKIKKFVVFELIFLFLIIICLGLYFYFENETKTNKKIYYDLKNEVKTKNKELDERNSKLSLLDEKIETYKDIDNSINKIRSDYFKAIKDLEDKIISGQSNKKIAYMTFDDGPYFNTYKVLDILDKYNVKATFFTISANGQYCHDNKTEDCFKLYKEYVKRGHTIANHTYTHAIFKGLYSSSDSFMEAIIKQEEHIKAQTGGYVTNITRFPGGSASAGKLKNDIIAKLRNRGYGWVDWSAGDGDGGGLSSNEQAFANFKSTINDSIEVILFHDYSKYTTAILPDVINYLKENEYEIYPLFYESNKINK
ncbi:MAG: polysaccharide deacetylase family protein [Bacilli bacterium]|nr:polysaccharide deacetylase family protein [Bacilli bacterium]